MSKSSDLFRRKIREYVKTQGGGSALAKKMGITPQAVSKIISPARDESPSLETLDKYAEALGVPPSSLIKEDHEKISIQEALEVIAEHFEFSVVPMGKKKSENGD